MWKLIYFVKLDHIWVANLLQDFDFTSNPLNIFLIFDFIFLKYFYCNFLPS